MDSERSPKFCVFVLHFGGLVQPFGIKKGWVARCIYLESNINKPIQATETDSNASLQ